jgi:hypothetical protein
MFGQVNALRREASISITEGFQVNFRELRTAPLWGIGQRLFFLHDGRTSDLLQAIEAHAGCTDIRGHDQGSHHHRFNNCSSEAYGVFNNFNALSPSQQQDILNFLRSL